MKKPKLTKEELFELYINKELSTAKIAKIAKRHTSTISEWLKEYNIPVRSRKTKFKINDDEMIRLYIEEELSLSQIAKIAGCTLETVRRRLLEEDVDRRGFSNYSLSVPKEQIKQWYLEEKLNMREIADILDCKPCTIWMHLDNMNVKTRSPSDELYTLPITKEEIGELYLSGKTTYEIGEIAECTANNIGSHLNKLGIETRPPTETSRKYEINENFFDKIDSEPKAYILGLLYADGCNSSNRNNIEIALTKTDKKLLEDIRDLIYPNKDRPIRYCETKHNNGKDMVHLTITNKHMSEKLDSWGVVPRKSLILKYPSFNLGDLERHFIRGYFDGDGSISKSGSTPSFSLIGTEHFITGAKRFLEKNIELNDNKIQKRTRNYSKPLCVIQYGGKQILPIYEFLYTDATIWLERKRKKFEQLIKWKRYSNI